MLPKLDAPMYVLELPSNGKKITYRPFLVKERKILMLALQEENSDGLLNAINEIFKVCTFGVCNLNDMPIIDSEYLFINIRNKSVGEDLDVIHTCECGSENEVRMTMNEIEVEGVIELKNIDLGNDTWIKMKYPTLDLSNVLSDDPTDDEIYKVIASCIESITKGEMTFNAEDSTLEELIEFVESLTQIQIEQMEEFFTTMPKIIIKKDYKCKSCGRENHIKLEGLHNFFD